ncbi:65-kDa microtubule-associated protein 8 [Apium graveolens]|uniref:65-kDa microtubule-associated protein 8 n=1 Tax=Apium graveolens TaxID=4045 RepID=UPI003D797C34
MGSSGTPMATRNSALLEKSCGYLLQELKIIWNEVGEDQCDREKILLGLEQECLEVYRKKVDSANSSRAQLHRELAESEAEFTQLLLSLGEHPLPRRPEKMRGALKEQIGLITPALQEMQLRKQERLKQFQAVQGQIQKILAEIAGESEYETAPSHVLTNEKDLSLKKLEEYQCELQRLQKEKNDRLQRVNIHLSTIQNLSSTLGMDSYLTVTKVHPSLNELSGLSKNISDSILAKLSSCVESLEAEKKIRLKKLHHLGKALTNLWNLMDTPYRYRQLFSHVTSLLSTSSAEILDPRSLTTDLIQQAEVEVKRLDQQKTTKMKELFVNKQIELEEVCKRSHMEIPSQPEMDNVMNLINSGVIDYADLLTSMDKQIQRAEEEAFSRKSIMEKVEKWILACDEERWLEEYMTDENRYSVSRGAHKNLKRAERARVMVNKIPSLMNLLIAKIKGWEEERNKVFIYDQIPLLVMLEEYNVSRQEKEDEKKRQKEKKKVQNLGFEQESLFGPRPGTGNRILPDRSICRSHSNAAPLERRISLSIQQLGSSNNYSPTQGILSIKEGKKGNQLKKFARSTTASYFKEETITMV